MPLKQHSILYAKLETTYGSDPTIAGVDARLVENVQFRHNVARYAQATHNNTMTPHREQVLGQRHGTISFDQLLAGSATAYAADEFTIQPFLNACGFSASYAANDWTFAEVSAPASQPSISIEYWTDGTVHAFRGCRGSGRIVFEPGQPVRISWTFSGLMEAPATQAEIAADYTDDVTPPLLTASGFTPFGHSPAVGDFEHTRMVSIDLRNALIMRQSLTTGTFGVLGFLIANRGAADDPGIEVIIEAEEKDVDVWGYWLARSSSRDIDDNALTITVASGVAINEFTFTITDLDVIDMEQIDFDGIYGQRWTCRALGTSTGDDALSIVAT